MADHDSQLEVCRAEFRFLKQQRDELWAELRGGRRDTTERLDRMEAKIDSTAAGVAEIRERMAVHQGRAETEIATVRGQTMCEVTRDRGEIRAQGVKIIAIVGVATVAFQALWALVVSWARSRTGAG